MAELGTVNSVPVTSGVPFTVNLSLKSLEFGSNAKASAGVYIKREPELRLQRTVAQIMTQDCSFVKDGNGGYRLYIEYLYR